MYHDDDDGDDGDGDDAQKMKERSLNMRNQRLFF